MKWTGENAGAAPGNRPAATLGRWVFGGGCLGLLMLILATGLPVWIWYWWRIEPLNGQIAVLIRKTGENLPPGEILATKPGQKGLQLEILPEGRYFRNPYTWTWEIDKITDIQAGKLGVLVRQFGKPLLQGDILAQPDEKGIVPEALGPGKHRINPYAYDVLIQDAIHIRPGSVGVVTSLVGKDVLSGGIDPQERNGFLVAKGLKGVLPEVLDPGTYYLNPFVWSVVEVNLQSQRFEMSGVDAIAFLTEDGFEVKVEGTIEFSIVRDKAALLTHQVGDMDDIVKKIIMPRARGFSRIEGSKKTAVDFIVGETRQEFQDNLEKHLRDTCESWGVAVHSVLIRNIIAPEDIAKVIRDRELAAQEARKLEQQMEQAKSKAELVHQEMLAEQNSKKVAAETIKLKAEIATKQEQSVKLIAAKRDKEVATIGRDAAINQAAALLLEAEASQAVIRKTNEAEAGVLSARTAAFGTGAAFARFAVYDKLAPRLKALLTTDGQAGFGLPMPAVGAPGPNKATSVTEVPK